MMHALSAPVPAACRYVHKIVNMRSPRILNCFFMVSECPQTNGCMLQMQAVQAKLVGVHEGSGGSAQSPNPRILVLRESGDVEVDVNLGDHENTPDGSFVRTVTHRHFSLDDEGEEERLPKGKSQGMDTFTL